MMLLTAIQDTEAENSVMVFKETKIKNIKEVTEPLKKQILKGDVHTIDEIESVASVAIAFVLAVLLKEIEN